MLKLINVGSYVGTSKKSTSQFIKDMIDAINNNSSVFTAEVYSSNSYRLNITSDNISIINIGAYSSSTAFPDCGLTIAIDDDKEFLIVLNRIILNTQTGNPNIQSDGIMGGTNSSSPPFSTMMCSTGKDINGNNFTVYGSADKSYTQGLSCWLDIGQHGTDDYTTEGDFILRQGAIRNHIVPELFFSMTRLGACGDIIEKDGHQYTCIAGPVFYQIS